MFDQHAVRFLEFLQAAGMKYWQVCPLGPTGYGDSPYQCFSAFAGNTYLVDLAALVPFDLLDDDDLAPLAALSADRTDYGAIYHLKPRLLESAYTRFKAQRPALPYGDFTAFCQKNADWLDAYAYFRALKDHFNGLAWWEWPPEARDFARAKKSPLRHVLQEPQ